jgi:hypothetical protein
LRRVGGVGNTQERRDCAQGRTSVRPQDQAGTHVHPAASRALLTRAVRWVLRPAQPALSLGVGALVAGMAVHADDLAPGSFPAVIELSSLDGTNGFVLRGVDSDDYSGVAASGAGDVNGDGIADIVIGAYHAVPNGQSGAGESYVVFGRATPFPAAFELRSLFPQGGGDGSAGFVLKGIDTDDRSGGSVSGAGDVNGDGIDDLIVGARFADPNRVLNKAVQPTRSARLHRNIKPSCCYAVRS